MGNYSYFDQPQRLSLSAASERESDLASLVAGSRSKQDVRELVRRTVSDARTFGSTSRRVAGLRARARKTPVIPVKPGYPGKTVIPVIPVKPAYAG